MVLVTLLTRLLVTFLFLGQTEGAVWADEIEMDSDSHIIYPETSTSGNSDDDHLVGKLIRFNS